MNASSDQPPAPVLARRIGLPLLFCYGLGTILGAGIYVLVGQVAASAGLLAPLAFLIAALVAGVTALSYCQLVVAFPHSSGAALFVDHGFERAWLTRLVGYLVILTGVVSAATLANGFVGYLQALVVWPDWLIICLVLLVMGSVSIWGIAESLWVAALITAIEALGLVWVIGLSAEFYAELPARIDELLVPSAWHLWPGIMGGAFLAFYAFVGFEDMVNIVEEVKKPEQNMPRGILLALGVATLLYLLVAVAAVLALPLEQLAASTAPVSDMVLKGHPGAAGALVFISMFAIINGVLTQLIMASRMLYGLADRSHAHRFFAAVSARTRTPWVATLAIIFLVLIFALALPLVTLARITSSVILLVFFLVNTALWRLERQAKLKRQPRLPCAPGLGAMLCFLLLVLQAGSLIS